MSAFISLGDVGVHGLVVSAVMMPVLAAVFGVLVTRRGLATLGFAAAAPMLLLGLAAPPAGVEVRIDWLLFGARFGTDVYSASFALLTGALWTAASVACAGYFDASARQRIAPWWLLSLAGSVGLVLALDAVTFFLFFALMSFASYGLVVHSGEAEAFRAGRIYIWYVVAGEVALFSGLVLAQTHPGAAAALLLVGFGIKAGALMLHSWLPMAHGAAPAPASAVLSGAMLKAGLLGWLRFVDPDAPWAEFAGLGLVALGIAGALAGAVLGITQRHPKVVLAYSSVSQMGIVIAAFGMLLAGNAVAGAAACAFFAVHHALAKGALFIGVVMVERLSGTARRVGLAVMLVPALGLVGIPFTSGAIAKAEIKTLAAGLPEPWASTVSWVLPVAAVGTALLMLRLFATMTPGPAGRCATALWAPVVALVAGGVALTFANAPAPGASLSVLGVAAALAPIVVAVGSLATWRWLSRATGIPALQVPAGDAAAAIEAWIAWLIGRLRSLREAKPRSTYKRSIGEPFRAYATGLMRRAERLLARTRSAAAATMAMVAVLFALLAVAALA